MTTLQNTDDICKCQWNAAPEKHVSWIIIIIQQSILLLLEETDVKWLEIFFSFGIS